MPPPKAVEVNETQVSEEASNKTEDICVNATSIEEVPVETSVVDLTIPVEEVLDVNESDKETSTNSLPSSTPTHEIPSLNTDVTNISEDANNAKKNPDEESSKPGKIFVLITLNKILFTEINYFVNNKYIEALILIIDIL